MREMENPLSLTSLGYPPTRAQFDTGATYVRSHFVSPFAFAAIRGLIALYCWTTIIVAYSWLSYEFAPTTMRDINLPPYTLVIGKWFIVKTFSYFTFIAWWSLAFYFTISAWHTFTYARHQSCGAQKLSHLHDGFPRWLQLAHSLFHTTITTYPFLVTIVFWATMFSGPWSASVPFMKWINISFHGLNSLFATSEIVLSAVPPPPFVSHLLVVSIGLSLYLAVAYITRADQGIYVYQWLNPANGWAYITAHVFSYAAAMIVIYSLVWGTMWARERLMMDRTPTRTDEEENASKLTTACSSPCYSFDGKRMSGKDLETRGHET